MTLRVRAAALLLLAAGWPVASPAETPKANGETLRVQYIAGGVMPAYIAEKRGLCAKYGFTCELKTINAAPLALQALVGGSIDVAFPLPDLAAASVSEGGDLVIVGTLRSDNHHSVLARSDVDLPNKGRGYPAVMQDFRGKKIGVTARGACGEIQFGTLLTAAGMKPSDVTFVSVGGPGTAFQALTVGRQVDAVMLFQPVGTLCAGAKTCETVIDLSKGEGPEALKAMNGAMIPLTMRREMVRSNPALVRAFLAAMAEAVAWANDPANLDAATKLFEPAVAFEGMPDPEALRRSLVRRSSPPWRRGSGPIAGR